MCDSYPQRCSLCDPAKLFLTSCISISAFGIIVRAKMVADKFKIKILLSQLRK
jgi:hypothetical protein